MIKNFTSHVLNFVDPASTEIDSDNLTVILVEGINPSERPKASGTGSFVHLEGILDFNNEIERLNKEIEKIQTELTSINKS